MSNSQEIFVKNLDQVDPEELRHKVFIAAVNFFEHQKQAKGSIAALSADFIRRVLDSLPLSDHKREEVQILLRDIVCNEDCRILAQRGLPPVLGIRAAALFAHTIHQYPNVNPEQAGQIQACYKKHLSRPLTDKTMMAAAYSAFMSEMITVLSTSASQDVDYMHLLNMHAAEAGAMRREVVNRFDGILRELETLSTDQGGKAALSQQIGEYRSRLSLIMDEIELSAAAAAAATNHLDQAMDMPLGYVEPKKEIFRLGMSKLKEISKQSKLRIHKSSISSGGKRKVIQAVNRPLRDAMGSMMEKYDEAAAAHDPRGNGWDARDAYFENVKHADAAYEYIIAKLVSAEGLILNDIDGIFLMKGQSKNEMGEIVTSELGRARHFFTTRSEKLKAEAETNRAELEKLETDEKTGMPNKVRFNRDLKSLLADLIQQQIPACFLFCRVLNREDIKIRKGYEKNPDIVDEKFFKFLNDGHIPVSIKRMLAEKNEKSIFNETSGFYRYDEDTVLAVIIDVLPEDVEPLCKRLRTRLGQTDGGLKHNYKFYFGTMAVNIPRLTEGDVNALGLRIMETIDTLMQQMIDDKGASIPIVTIEA